MSDVVGTIEGVRQWNLARILRLVHVEGPQSRATITETTGLNRSTIADLVGELVRRGLVEEHAPDPSRRVGRPSPVVAPASDVVAIAANPEVDALEIAAVGLDRSIPVRERIEVNRLLTPAEAAALIASTIQAWKAGPLAEARLVGVGLAVPGLVRASDGLVRNAPHLHWTDEPLRDLVQEATGLPAVVGNDATLGTIAEHLFGAARGLDHVVYLNGGASGIGGGLIVNGVPLAGAGGYAGEFGQNRPGIATEADRRAHDGVLEDEVSRARLLSVARLTSGDDPALAAALAASTSPEVPEELARQRRILATALSNAVNVLNPSAVVLGGFLATIAEHDPEGLRELVSRQAMSANAEDLDIRSAELAQDRLLIGAAESAFGALLRDPLSIPA
ncbi:ROK family transcriptional regulator [Microbacterium sp. NPDC019599]|uniref:ROK family transcriptional regulator n=1 Tax=Microbacterium sp. NPDC019599 TaxID=3154690 RepID=UPI003401F94D